MSRRDLAIAEDDLAAQAIERSRELAHDFARDADLQLWPPTDPVASDQNGTVVTGKMVVHRE